MSDETFHLDRFLTSRTGKELLPLVITLALLVVMAVPMMSGVDSIISVQAELDLLYRDVRYGTLRLLEEILLSDAPPTHSSGIAAGPRAASPAATGSLSTEVARLRRLALFFPGLDLSAQSLERALEEMTAIQHVGSAEETLRLLSVMRVVEDSFSVLHGELQAVERQRNRLYNSIALVGLITALLFFALFLRGSVQNRVLERDKRYRYHVAALARKVQEEERRAIARDLHDGTAQELAIARLAVDKVTDQRTRTMIQSSLTRAIEEIRLITRRLRPIVRPEDSLATILQGLIGHYSDRGQLLCTLNLDRRLAVQWSDDEVQHFYRMPRRLFPT